MRPIGVLRIVILSATGLLSIILLSGGCRREPVSQRPVALRKRPSPTPRPAPPDILPYGLQLGMTGAQALTQLSKAGIGGEVCATTALARRGVLPPRYLGLPVADVKCGAWPLHKMTVSFPIQREPKESQALLLRLRKALEKSSARRRTCTSTKKVKCSHGPCQRRA